MRSQIVLRNPDGVRGKIQTRLDMTRRDLQQEAQRLSPPWAISKSFGKSALLSQHYELKAGDNILAGRPAGIDSVESRDVITAGIEGLGEIEVAITEVCI